MKHCKLLVGLLISIITIGLTGCGAGNSLVGTWYPDGGQNISSSFPEKKMELLKDESAIIDGYGFTWKTESSRVYFTSSLMAYSYDYKVSGATLTLTGDDNQSVTYTKK